MERRTINKQFIKIVIPIVAQNLLSSLVSASDALMLPALWVYALLNIDEIIKLPAVYRYYKKYNWAKNITKER